MFHFIRRRLLIKYEFSNYTQEDVTYFSCQHKYFTRTSVKASHSGTICHMFIKINLQPNALFQSVVHVNGLQWISGIWIIPECTIQLILELDEG